MNLTPIAASARALVNMTWAEVNAAVNLVHTGFKSDAYALAQKYQTNSGNSSR